MRACDRLGELVEQWFLNLCKLGWIHDFEDILDFIQEHDLLCAVDLWPVPEKTQYDLRR